VGPGKLVGFAPSLLPLSGGRFVRGGSRGRGGQYTYRSRGKNIGSIVLTASPPGKKKMTVFVGADSLDELD